MRLAAILIPALAVALSGSVGAQVSSQQRIPVRKQRPPRVDTVVVRVVDTVVIQTVDTLYVLGAAPMTTFDSLVKTDTLQCSNAVIPVPIPIPIPTGGRDSPSTPVNPSTPPTSVTPEPATLWLV